MLGNRCGILRFSILCASVSALTLTATPVAAQEVRSFNIAAQPLSSALLEFSRQSGVMVVVAPGMTEGKRSPALKGTMPVNEAIGRLLRGSHLRAAPNAAGGYVVSAEGNAPAAVAVTTGSQAAASTGEASPVDQTAIVVTAQKRDERLRDVPVPVTALAANELVNDNRVSLADYYNKVPGMNLALDNRGSPAIAVRGLITTIYGNPTVATVVDDVPYSGSTVAAFSWAATDIDPNELERVEVLRGPQGVLYGASSLGGLIKYVTIAPSFSGVNGRLQVSANDVEHGSQPGYGVSGALNSPLSDTLAVRVSGFGRHDAGYVDNLTTGQHGINEGHVLGGRLSALWKPSSDFSLQLSALLQGSKTSGSPNVEPNVGDLEQRYIRGTGGYDRTLQAYTATMNASLGPVHVTSITGFAHTTSKGSFDTTTVAAGGSAFFFGYPYAAWVENNKTKKLSEEARFSGSVAHFDWLLGLFYTHERTDLDGGQYAFQSDVGGERLGHWFTLSGPATYTEKAAFANFTYHFTDRLNVQFGARYSSSDQSLIQTTSLGAGAPVTDPKRTTSDNATTYLITPSYHITPDVLLYGRFATGFRPGGINALMENSVHPHSFGPDKTQNYEVGLKGDFFDHLLGIDASLYSVNWQDIQITLSDTKTTESWAENLGAARSRGIEFAANLRPTSHLSVDGWIALSNAELTKAFPPTSVASGVPGDRLPYSPKVSGTLSVQERFPLGSFHGYVRGSATYVGRRQGEFSAGFGGGRQNYNPYTEVNLQFGAESGDWHAQLFANNIFDKRGVLAGGIGTLNPTAFTVIRPRTIGVSLSRTF